MVNYSRLAAVAILAGLTNALPRDYTQAEIAALVPNGDVSMDFKTVSSGRFDGKFGMSRLAKAYYSVPYRAFSVQLQY